LNWVRGNPESETEQDEWDKKKNVVHFGVNFCGVLLAYARALTGGLDDVMLGHDFKFLLGGETRELYDAETALEVTRMCISPVVPKFMKKFVTALLYLRIRAWSITHGRSRVWAVTSQRVAQFKKDVTRHLGFGNFTIASEGKMPGDDHTYLVVYADVDARIF
jgi:hypothetical protein